MTWKVGLALGTILAWAGPAAAWDRPLFDFHTEVPVPGGMLRLQARCEAGGHTVNCRAEGRGPSGRGFRAEGKFSLTPQAPAAPEPTWSPHTPPRWF